ncbi:LysR substrate-binding domain-containing protein [Novosphingobium taihuense]|uniref:DNA-binding transcriptional LysR family regulator n=1 Tax=Novosphingobium taihuense TaxID=260085 RepID=A0A7W7ABY0_9SPHN|nr:LysR substrate-binding domain-containing protein [Novosphingobium taihuense]MBB4614199.1 DNA-binding transcriptional LysR family regulator [Novosphingobium taihuense]TWH87048.1 DNA-binding transcriptional LysR family regulator [Novosphingobium taihuense]
MALPTLPPFATLRAFDMVGRSGGIRKAAAQLGLSHAIVSRHLATLEQYLGLSLFNRRTGELTEHGRRYHARIAAAIAELEAATTDIRGTREHSLSIWCSAGFSLHWLAQRLADFQRRATSAGGLVVDLRSTDAEPMFERGEADGDIRYLSDAAAKSLPAAVRAELLARPDVFPVTSPELLGFLSHPLRCRADILQLPLVDEGGGEEWAEWLAVQRVAADLRKPPVARFGQAHLALMAARSGQGVALANAYLVADDLARGTLVRVLPGDDIWEPAPIGAYYFRCARARWSDPLLARFRRWLRNAVQTSA